MEKRCPKCGETKPITEFSSDNKRKDKHDPHCKKCKKIYSDTRRKEKREHVLFLEYINRQRNHEKINEQYRKYSRTEKGRNTIKKYRQSEEGKKAKKKSFIKQAQKFPEKIAARTAVNIAVMCGKIPKAKTFICCVCKNKQAEHYHHHKGYAIEHRLDVVPVCDGCHKSIEHHK